MGKNPDLSALELGEGEVILKESKGVHFPDLLSRNILKVILQFGYTGNLYLTNRRIFFYGAKLLKKNKHIVFDFQIDSVVRISTARNFITHGGRKYLNIETVSDNAQVSNLKNIDSWVDAINMAKIAISERHQKPPVMEAPPKPRKTLKQCPSCGGKFSEINFYKLKAGNDIECDFCGEIIES